MILTVIKKPDKIILNRPKIGDYSRFVYIRFLDRGKTEYTQLKATKAPSKSFLNDNIDVFLDGERVFIFDNVLFSEI